MSDEKMRKKAYEIAEERRVRSADPVEDEIYEEERELARDAKRLRLEEIVARRKKRLQEAQGVSGLTAGSDQTFAKNVTTALATDPAAWKQWLEFTEEQRSTVLQGIGMMSAATGGAMAGGGGLGLAMMMMGAMKASPGLDAVGLVNLIKAVNPQPAQPPLTLEGLVKVIEVSKPAAQPQGGISQFEAVKNFLEPFYRTLTEETQKRFATEIEGIKKEIVNPNEYMDAVFNTAQRFGWRPPGEGTTANIEIERMKVDHDKWKTEKEWEMQRWQAEMGLKQQSEKDRNTMLTKLLAPTLKRAGPLIDSAIDKGKQKIDVLAPAGAKTPPQTVIQVPVGAQAFKCTGCGNMIPVTGPPYPDMLTCEKCGAEYPKVKG